MVNPSTQVLGGQNQVDIRIPVPQQATRIAQWLTFIFRFKNIFCQDITDVSWDIFDDKFEEIFITFSGVFSSFNANNRLEFVFPAWRGLVLSVD